MMENVHFYVNSIAVDCIRTYIKAFEMSVQPLSLPCLLSACDTSTPTPASGLFQNTLSNILQSYESMSGIWLRTSVHLLP